MVSGRFSIFEGCVTTGIEGISAQAITNLALGGNISLIQCIVEIFLGNRYENKEETDMKIRTFNYYKTTITVFIALGVLLNISSLVMAIEIDEYKIFYYSIPISLVIAFFPIIIDYKHIISIYLDHEKAISYSLLNKKLCQVNFKDTVFYSIFDVKFLYATSVRFIAVSNEPFLCDENCKSVFKRGFYGSYDQKSIIIFPYITGYPLLQSFLNDENWRNTRDG